MVNFYIYYNIYIHTHTYIHIYIYIYLFINIKNSGKPKMVYRYWPVSKIYRTGSQTGTASGTVLTSLIPSAKSFAITFCHQGVLLALPHANLREFPSPLCWECMPVISLGCVFWTTSHPPSWILLHTSLASFLLTDQRVVHLLKGILNTGPANLLLVLHHLALLLDLGVW